MFQLYKQTGFKKFLYITFAFLPIQTLISTNVAILKLLVLSAPGQLIEKMLAHNPFLAMTMQQMLSDSEAYQVTIVVRL